MFKYMALDALKILAFTGLFSILFTVGRCAYPPPKTDDIYGYEHERCVKKVLRHSVCEYHQDEDQRDQCKTEDSNMAYDICAPYEKDL